MQLEDGKFYRTADDKTFMIWQDPEDGKFYGFWHEQMLDEPNHGAVEFNQQGQAVSENFLTRATELLGVEFDLVRECTQEELATIEKEIDDTNRCSSCDEVACICYTR